MKKWILRAGLVLVALFIVTLVAVAVFIDDIVKKGVETSGPMITKVVVKLDGANISLFSGGATLKGLFVGNPNGYTTDSAIKVGEVSVSLKPMSVLSDRIMVASVHVKAPEITLEGGLKDNNLTKIQSNVSGVSGGASGGVGAASGGSSKKIQVADLMVSGAILHVKSPLLANRMVTVTLPDIHLTNLGTGSDGVTPAELTDKVMNSLMKEVIPAVTKLISNAGIEAIGLGKNAGKAGSDAVKKATGGLRSLIGQ